MEPGFDGVPDMQAGPVIFRFADLVYDGSWNERVHRYLFKSSTVV
jgi:hypothetical protein